jgi:chromosome segregation ATPase
LSAQVAAAELAVQRGKDAEVRLREAESELQILAARRAELDAEGAVAAERIKALAEQVQSLEAKATRLSGVQVEIESSAKRLGALEAQIRESDARVSEAKELLVKRNELELEVKRLEVVRVQAEASLGKRLADQFDQVLTRLAGSLARIEGAASEPGAVGSDGTPPATPAGGGTP